MLGNDYVRLPGHPCDFGKLAGMDGRLREREPVIPIKVITGALPICPVCKDTKQVAERDTGKLYQNLYCKMCKVEWNRRGQVWSRSE